MKYIRLTQGKQTIVDDEDYEYLSQWKWSYDGRYARRGIRKGGINKKIYLHQVLSKPSRGLVVDHINGDKLDNRKENLRNITSSQNNYNHRREPHSSGYVGLWWWEKRKTWQVHVGSRSVGYRKNKEDAIKLRELELAKVKLP